MFQRWLTARRRGLVFGSAMHNERDTLASADGGKWSRAWLLALAVTVLVVLFDNRVYAEQAPLQNTEVTVNYAYAAQLGFGGYDIGGLTVDVYHLPFALTFPLAITETPWELKLKLPLGYGHFQFDGRLPDQTKISADLKVVSFGGGLELKIPVASFWSLKPFADFGFVSEISSSVSPSEVEADFPFSYYYTGGLKSLLQYKCADFTFGLGNAVVYAGNEAFDGSGGEFFSAFEAGVDARHPLGFSVKNYVPDADVFFIYYHYFSPVIFTRFLQEPLEIENQFEFGIAFGFERPSKIWFLEDPRIGASYLFDGDNALNAFRITFGFPF